MKYRSGVPLDAVTPSLPQSEDPDTPGSWDRTSKSKRAASGSSNFSKSVADDPPQDGAGGAAGGKQPRKVRPKAKKRAKNAEPGEGG